MKYYILFCLIFSLPGLLSAQQDVKVKYALKYIEDAGSRLVINTFRSDNAPFLVEDSYASLLVDGEKAFSSIHISKYALGGPDSTVVRLLTGRDYWQDSTKAYTLIDATRAVPENYISFIERGEGAGEVVPWVIHEENKMIGDYRCFKATSRFISRYKEDGTEVSRPVVAWFSPELPYPFGPLQFSGLPGLILELQTDSALFGATNVSFSDGIEIPDMPNLKQVKSGTNETINIKRAKELKTGITRD